MWPSCAGNLGRMKPGQLAPDFSLPDQDGTPRSLTSLLENGPLVLFFYPAASTPVCTAEACHFRDLGSEFAAVGASRAGISTDTVEAQSTFATAQSFDYPLLADTDGKVAETVRRQARTPGQVGSGQTLDLRDRHRPHRPQSHLE